MLNKARPVFLILTWVGPLVTSTLAVAAASTMSASGDMSTGVGREIYTPPDLDKLTSDARKWYLQGVENAKKNLPQFESIEKLITEGSDTYKPQLKVQLKSLLDQAEEANENTKVLVPRLSGLVSSMDQWTVDEPIPFWSKLKLKTIMWYINGKRDNKSYYLQNGAGLWAKMRVDILKPKYSTSSEAEKVGKMLDGLKEDLLLARDELDDAAQIYVKGVDKLVSLVQDVGKNGSQIRRIIKELKASGEERNDRIINSAQTSVDNIKKQIDAL